MLHEPCPLDQILQPEPSFMTGRPITFRYIECSLHFCTFHVSWCQPTLQRQPCQHAILDVSIFGLPGHLLPAQFAHPPPCSHRDQLRSRQSFPTQTRFCAPSRPLPRSATLQRIVSNLTDIFPVNLQICPLKLEAAKPKDQDDGWVGF